MAELELKEGQTYLLDGNVLVEASFNDTTGMWQLHESEERANWLVSPNGRLLGMQLILRVMFGCWLVSRMFGPPRIYKQQAKKRPNSAI
jgi:hypothetical protein